MQLENLVPSFMRKIFRHGVPYAFMGDGSSDSSMAEVEDTEFCMIGPGGKPRLHFGDLDELDLSQSKDGKSPDAQCIFASYKKTQQRLQLPESEVCTHQPRVSHNYFEGSSACKNIIFNNKAEDALVCQNLDGASVNQGENEGVAAHTARWAEQSTTTHSVAHVNQICTGHAFEEDPYYFEFRRIVNAVVAHYSQSGKKRKALQQIFALLCPGSVMLLLVSLHGIRWVEAASRTLLNLFWMLPTIIAELGIDAQEAFNAEAKSVLTSNEQFIGEAFKEQVQNAAGKHTWRKFTVLRKVTQVARQGLSSIAQRRLSSQVGQSLVGPS